MNYRPTLSRIQVSANKLLLDPNNPRFLVNDEDSVDEDNYADSGSQTSAGNRMAAGGFDIDQLAESIRKNGWQPVDMIFVKRLKGDKFVVLEGNRRVTAVRKILEDKATPKELRASLDPLTVLEVVGEGERVSAQITYLLGVRHHGSLKKWGAFAQAHSIYERYLRIAKMNDQTFRWDPKVASDVAGTLGLEEKKVHERLEVYRVMKQINDLPEVRLTGGGIAGRHYSLTREVLTRPKKSPLRTYVKQDSETFLVDDESLSRLDRVCHFSRPNRKDAPISNPQEWRDLERILLDQDSARVAVMLKRVEVDKHKPSDVYAERAAELRQPRWDRWLKEVGEVLRKVQMGDIPTKSDARSEAVATAKQLAKVLDGLGKGAM